MLSPVAPTSVAPQKLSERIVVDSEAASEFKKIIEEIETFEETYQDQKLDGLDEPGVPDRSQDDDVSDNYDLPTPERFLLTFLLHVSRVFQLQQLSPLQDPYTFVRKHNK